MLSSQWKEQEVNISKCWKVEHGWIKVKTSVSILSDSCLLSQQIQIQTVVCYIQYLLVLAKIVSLPDMLGKVFFYLMGIYMDLTPNRRSMTAVSLEVETLAALWRLCVAMSRRISTKIEHELCVWKQWYSVITRRHQEWEQNIFQPKETHLHPALASLSSKDSLISDYQKKLVCTAFPSVTSRLHELFCFVVPVIFMS